MAIDVSTGLWRLIRNNTKSREILNNSGGTLAAGTLVNISGAGAVAAAGDANTLGAHGVITDDIANGEKGGIYTDGEFAVGASPALNFAIDEAVFSLAAGLVDKGSSADIEVGRIAPFEDPANGAIVLRVLLTSQIETRTPVAVP